MNSLNLFTSSSAQSHFALMVANQFLLNYNGLIESICSHHNRSCWAVVTIDCIVGYRPGAAFSMASENIAQRKTGCSPILFVLVAVTLCPDAFLLSAFVTSLVRGDDEDSVLALISLCNSCWFELSYEALDTNCYGLLIDRIRQLVYSYWLSSYFHRRYWWLLG